jgi:rSAM/selenodomain-associated transferase 1
MLNRSRVFFYIVYHPPDALEQFKNWLGNNYHYLFQKGNNLGERLKFAFQKAFSKGFEQVIALASDVPDLNVSVIKKAFHALQTVEAVIGPSPDGGYYLIGFQSTSFHSTIFDGISWSSDKVFSQTYTKFNNLGLDVKFLTPWRDVDTVTDLKTLIKRNENKYFTSSYTMAYLRPYYSYLNNERICEDVI